MHSLYAFMEKAKVDNKSFYFEIIEFSSLSFISRGEIESWEIKELLKIPSSHLFTTSTHTYMIGYVNLPLQSIL